MVRGGGWRRTWLRFDLSVEFGDGVPRLVLATGLVALGGRIVSKLRLCASVLERRSVASKAAVWSGECGSPKMKYFMNAPRRRTMESCPRRRPCVNERLAVS